MSNSATPTTAARQAPLSMGFSRQEYWSGLPCPPSGDLPDPGVPHTTGRFFTMWASRQGLAFKAQRLVHTRCVHDPAPRPPLPQGPSPHFDPPSTKIADAFRTSPPLPVRPHTEADFSSYAHGGLARLSNVNPYKWVTSASERPAPSPHPHSGSPGVTVPWRDLQAFVLAGHSCFDCDPALLFCLAEKWGRKNKSPLLLFSGQVTSDVLWPQGLRHTRLPRPSPSPGACSNSCPLSRWCHSNISSSVVPFSSCPQSCPASRSFPESWLFTSGG